MIHIFRWKNVRILVLHQRPLLARVEVYDGREVVVVLVEPPVREPLSVVVQQAATLVMSPGGAGGAVRRRTEISTVKTSQLLKLNQVWGNTWQSYIIVHLSVSCLSLLM